MKVIKLKTNKEGKSRKGRVAYLSVISNTFLITMKVAAGVLSGSVSIISEAIHSSMDLVASLIAFFSVKESMKPADKKHPFGHGKIENISGIIEGTLILVAAVMIIYQAIRNLLGTHQIEQLNIAIIVMFISAVVNFFVSRKLYEVGKAEDSMALEADALHLKTDIYTSIGVGVGMLIIKLTGIIWLDSVVALFVAALIIKEAFVLVKNAFDWIMDSKLPDEEEAKIKEAIEVHKDSFINYHKLKTTKSGDMKLIDFHLTLEPNTTVKEAHALMGILKKDLDEKLGNTRVSIHIDPGEE